MGYWFRWLVCYVLPFITAGVFFGGLAYRVVHWWRSPRASVSLVLPPETRSVGKTVGQIATEIVSFRRVFRVSRRFWAVTWPFHVSIFVFVLGHFRLFIDFTWLWNLLRLTPEQVDLLAFVGGGAAGMVFMLGILALLVRRFLMPTRSLSVPSDYFLLLLLLALAVTGNYMRFFMHIELAEYRAFFSNLFGLRWGPPLENWVFVWHFLLVQTLLIYLPFSKLVHIIGGVLTLKWTLR